MTMEMGNNAKTTHAPPYLAENVLMMFCRIKLGSVESITKDKKFCTGRSKQKQLYIGNIILCRAQVVIIEPEIEKVF